MAKKSNYENGFKLKIAVEAIKGDKTYDELSTEYSVSKSLISKWRDELLKKGETVYSKEFKANTDEAKEKKLYQQIGKLTMEVEFLKKFLSKYQK